MIIFSKITCRADKSPYVYSGLVSGTPYSFADLVGWLGFESCMKEYPPQSKVTIEVETFGYGEDDGYGKFDATVEEVAYMIQRLRGRADFLESRCEKIGHHTISFTWDPEKGGI